MDLNELKKELIGYKDRVNDLWRSLWHCIKGTGNKKIRSYIDAPYDELIKEYYNRLLNEYGKIRISVDLITIKEKYYVLFYDYYKGEILAIWIFDGLDDPKLTEILTPYFNNENIELIVSVRGYVSKFVPILKEISPKNTKFISYLKF